MANKSKRFATESVAGETPGPGAYSLSKRTDWLKETGQQSNSAPSPNKGRESVVSHPIISH